MPRLSIDTLIAHVVHSRRKPATCRCSYAVKKVKKPSSLPSASASLQPKNSPQSGQGAYMLDWSDPNDDYTVKVSVETAPLLTGWQAVYNNICLLGHLLLRPEYFEHTSASAPSSPTSSQRPWQSNNNAEDGMYLLKLSYILSCSREGGTITYQMCEECDELHRTLQRAMRMRALAKKQSN